MDVKIKDYSVEELELLANNNYSKFRKAVIEIKLDNIDFYNEFVIHLEKKYAYKGAEIKERERENSNNEITTIKKEIRNTYIAMTVLPILLVLYFVSLADKINNSQPFGPVLFFIILVAVGFFRVSKRKRDLEELQKRMQNYNSSILSYLNINAIKYYKAAKVSIENKNYTDALDNLNNAIAEDKTVGGLYIERSGVYSMLGNQELANKDIVTAKLCD